MITHLRLFLKSLKKSKIKDSQMQGKVNSDLWFCLSEEGYSLDELVTKLKELFENKGFSEILSVFLRYTQEVIYLQTMASKRTWKCCDHPSYRSNGSYKRSIKTSLGEVNIELFRIQCSMCKKEIVPLKSFLNLEDYQTKSNELERVIVDAMSANSYRRSVESIDSIGFVSVPHTTAHRWVMESDCDSIEISNDIIGSAKISQVMADGTKFKGRNGAKGDLKLMVGINSKGQVFPIGSWAGEGWKDISKRLEDNKIKFPEGTILICDGEPGLASAFENSFSYSQRCHWHITRDLYHAMWQDGGTSKKSKPLQEGLSGVLAIELPESDFQQVSENEKDEIEKRMDDSERVIGKLIEFLDEKGYAAAASYLESARQKMFDYVRRWLKYGLISPRTSSLIERIIRELGRRLKKIAYNWSDAGASKITRIILKKFTSPEKWDEYWRDKAKIIGNVVLSLNNIKV